MALVTKFKPKKQRQRVKISLRPPPSSNVLPLPFFILAGSHLYSQLVGFVTTDTTLAARSKNTISREFQGIEAAPKVPV